MSNESENEEQSQKLTLAPKMKIAIVGCAHGEIEEILNAIQRFEKQKECSVDLLICCGDFQAIRNENDLQNMTCPLKYRKLNSFYKYYSGELKVPFPVICIGGNHEASNYFFELYHGGWLAPNIYFLGHCGSILFGGLRISGVSGIFKQNDFEKGLFETCPMNESMIYSSYHIRRYQIWKLSQLHGTNIDIMLSHEWPTCIPKYGNYQSLVKWKPHFVDDIKHERLGNPALNHLLFQLQPKQWFAGHLHCKFSASVHHKDTNDLTKFLALDKFVNGHKRRQFVQVLDIDCPIDAQRDELTGFYKFEYDPVWLAIVKSTNKHLSVDYHSIALPMKDGDERWDFRPTKEEVDDIMQRFEGNMDIPHNFVPTAEVTKIANDPQIGKKGKRASYIVNPQTVELMNKLGIKDKLMEKHQKMNERNGVNGNGVPYSFGKKRKSSEDDDEVFQWIAKKQKLNLYNVGDYVEVSKDDDVCGAKILEIKENDNRSSYLLHFNGLSPFQNEWVSEKDIIRKLDTEKEEDIDDADEIKIDIDMDKDPNEIDIDGDGDGQTNDDNNIDIDDPNEIIL